MTRFVHDYLWPLLFLLTLQISVADGSELRRRVVKKNTEPFYAFENTAVRRLLVRSVSGESVASSGTGSSFTSSPRADSRIDSVSDSSSSVDSPARMLASGLLPERLVEFLTLNPFPFQVDKYRRFNPMEREIWIKYFLLSRLTLLEVFTLIEKLFEDVEATEGSSGWFFPTRNTKMVEVIFGTALFVYFKGNLGASVSKIFLDLNLVKCSARIQNKLQNI